MNKSKIKRIIATFSLILIYLILASRFHNHAISENAFNDEIRSTNWHMTKEDIIKLEDREPDHILQTMYDDILEFSNTKLKQYLGTIKYGIDRVTGKLHYVEFIFNEEKEYEEYRSTLNKKYRNKELKYLNYWVWTGLEDNQKIIFYCHRSTLSVKKYIVDDTKDSSNKEV